MDLQRDPASLFLHEFIAARDETPLLCIGRLNSCQCVFQLLSPDCDLSFQAMVRNFQRLAHGYDGQLKFAQFAAPVAIQPVRGMSADGDERTELLEGLLAEDSP